MARRRLTLLALAGSIILAAGCQCTSNGFSLFRSSRPSTPDCCCCEGGGPIVDGPVLPDSGPVMVPMAPANGAFVPPPPAVVPQPAPQGLTPVPSRLVPQPQSQPQAYRPQ